MFVKYLYIAVCFFICFNCLNAIETVNGRVKITVGTASGCTDTARFIHEQLEDAYNSYGDFLDIEFVPWGRTTRNDDGSLTCQFGPNDCWANRVHRCALSLLEGDQEAQLDYMSCEFTAPFPAYTQHSYVCAAEAGLSLVEVDYCVTTTGTPLDEAAEDAAREPMSVINFVPSIHFNDDVNLENHHQGRSRLSSMICFALSHEPGSGVTHCQI